MYDDRVTAPMTSQVKSDMTPTVYNPRGGPMVGPMIREWRQTRRMTQAELAEDAEVSTRHLSCVENGKAQPSREMVLVLCSALDMPLRQRNAVLEAAGFAPAYDERDFDAPDYEAVRDGLGFLLQRMEPFGAVVVDRSWNVVLWNRPMSAMATWLLGEEPKDGNLLRSTFDPDGLRPFIVNWPDVAVHTLNVLHREALHTGSEAVAHLRDELAAVPGVPEWRHREPKEAVLLPIRIAKDGMELAFFTTIATLGTAADVTLSELRIESYFPADPGTAERMALLAGMMA